MLCQNATGVHFIFLRFTKAKYNISYSPEVIVAVLVDKIEEPHSAWW
jgi:hypothetical protein